MAEETEHSCHVKDRQEKSFIGETLMMAKHQQDPVQLSINTIRTLSMDAVQQANSGHPGTPMAMAPVV